MTKPLIAMPQLAFGRGRLSIFASAAAVAIAASRWTPSGQLSLWLAVTAIAVAIWHGAFDGVLAEESFQPLFGPRWKAAFYSAYLALAAAVLLLWWRAPVVALPAFLLYSALHFGTEAERRFSPARLARGIAAGFVPIAAACNWWPQQVTATFGLMLHGHAVSAASIATLAGCVLWPVVAVALLGALLTDGWHSWPVLALVAVELPLFHYCTPTAAFALFFCLWHTPEHMLSTSMDPLGTFQSKLLAEHLRRGIVPWLVSLAGVSGACWMGRHQVGNYIGVIFIALSALTVPHMLLSELCRRQHRSLLRNCTHRPMSQQLVIR